MTPWQYLRTIDNNLDLHTGTRSAITGMRAATGGRQPAAAKPSLYFYVCGICPAAFLGLPISNTKRNEAQWMSYSAVHKNATFQPPGGGRKGYSRILSRKRPNSTCMRSNHSV